MIGAITGLLAAFMTYVGAFTGQVVLYLVYRLLFAIMDFDVPALPSSNEKSEARVPPDSERTRAALEALEVEGWNMNALGRVTKALNPILHLGFVVGLFVATGESR